MDRPLSTPFVTPPPMSEALLSKLIESGRAFARCACNGVFVADDDESAQELLAEHNCPLAPRPAPPRAGLTNGWLRPDWEVVFLIAIALSPALIMLIGKL